MSDKTSEKIKQIKRTFRLFMNGVASRSMREKGLDYKIIWGVPLVELRRMAAEFGRDYELAITLWKDDVRECKILATMIMPPSKLSMEDAEVWMSECTSAELAEMLALNLFQHVEHADKLVYRWLEDVNPLSKLCAYHLLNRMILNGYKYDDDKVLIVLSAINSTLTNDNVVVKHASLNCLYRLLDADKSSYTLASDILKKHKLDIFQ